MTARLTTVRRDRLDRLLNNEDQLIERIAKADPFSSRTRGCGGWIAPGNRRRRGNPGARRGHRVGFELRRVPGGVHFLAASYPPDSVGYKSLVRATSDLAAMGARPRLFLLTLALPTRLTGNMARRVPARNGRAARQLGMRLAGGDTSRSAQRLDQHHRARRSASGPGRHGVRARGRATSYM